MSGCESVILALLRVGKSAQSTEFAVGSELVAPSCKKLVPVCLMSDIPHDAVVWSVEHIVQGHGKFYGPHA